MKTNYNQLKLWKILKIPTLVFLMLTLSYMANAQRYTGQPFAVCYGTNMYLFACSDASNGNNPTWCDSTFSTYKWFYRDAVGNERDIFDGSFSPTWHAKAPTEFTPHGDSWQNPVITAGDAGYEFIAQKSTTGGGFIYLSIRHNQGGQNPEFSAGSVNARITKPFNIGGTVTNILCNGGANGSIVTSLDTAYGGYGPYNYTWNTGATTTGLSGLAIGTYTVTVKDYGNCTKSQSFTVSQPAGMSINASKVDVSCSGYSNGSATVSVVSGGTSPFTYLWTTGGTTTTISSLAIGTYTVTVTDHNSCTKTASATVGAPAGMTLTPTPVGVSCFGGSNGSIGLSVTGGTPAYTYSWSSTATTKDISGLIAGTYTVTVTDNNGCTKTTSSTVIEPSILVVTPTATDILCNGNLTGSITLAVSGGTPSFTYNWNTGATVKDLVNVAAGTYSVTVTDSKGCTKTSGGTINQPPALLITNTVITQVACFNQQTGAINISVSGGTAPLTFNWVGPSFSATTQNIGPVFSGTYSVTVTDHNGCKTFGGGTITQPSTLPKYQAAVTNVSCFNSCNGKIVASAYDGTPGYTYLWSNGQTVTTINNLCNGTYTLTVTDSKGCLAIASDIVTQPAAALSAVPTVTDILCNGSQTGSITLAVTGGTPAYTYNWNTGTTVKDLVNVAAGTYTVTVTDNHGCTTTTGGTINQAPALLITNTVITHVACFNQQTGAINITVTGGTAPLTFNWVGPSFSATTQNIGPVFSGTYSVTVTDHNGCKTFGGGTITQPSTLPKYQAAVTNVTCFNSCNGKIVASAYDGTPGYTYLWSSGQTVSTISNLCNGTYTLTVTDSKGCLAIASDIVTQPAAALSAVPTVTDILCNGSQTGSITLAVTGGTPAYTYNWNTGTTVKDLVNVAAGTYTVTVTDNHGCTTTTGGTINQPAALLITNTVITHVACFNQQTGAINITVTGGTAPLTFNWVGPSFSATTQNIGPVFSGTYSVTVTDHNGCKTFGGGTITQPSTLPKYQAAVTNVTCFNSCNGKIVASAYDGTPGYTYLWSSGQTVSTITNLCNGTYTLTVTDSKGCLAIASDIVTQPAAALSAVPTVTDILCNGSQTGSITLAVTGGTPAYTYNWNTGTTVKDLVNVAAGTYTVTVTDNHGCTTTTGGTINQPPALLITNTVITHVACFNQQTGAINITVTGGTAPLTFNWVGPSFSATTQNIGPVFSGTYSVTVTDHNGCKTFGGGTITQPSTLPKYQASVTNVSCFNSCNGKIVASAYDGTPGYTYLWSSGQTVSTITNLCNGTYTLTVTDSKGCLAISSDIVTQPAAALSAVPTVTDILCNGFQTGSITLAVTGGTPAYTYNWNSGATVKDLINVIAGTYTVTVTDSHGCTTTTGGTINQPPALSITNTVITHVNCFNEQTGAINISVSGGVLPYTFNWVGPSFSATTQNIGPVFAGTYSVTVTDHNGCQTFGGGTVTQPSSLPKYRAVVTDANCFGDCNGKIVASAYDGTPGYSYLWSSGQTTSTITGLCIGTYTLTVTDSKGCLAISSNIVSQPDQIVLTDATPHNITCFGGNDGSICVTPHGGTPGYTYAWSNGMNDGNCISVLIAGTYSVTVTDSHGCTATNSWTLTEPPHVHIQGVVTHVPCFGGNGSIVTTVTVGVPDFTYLWSNGATTKDLDPAAAGTYTVHVWDANMCSDSAVFTITQPDMLIVSLTLTHNHCYTYHEGSITTNVTGGTPAYTYLWSNSETTPNIYNLGAGTYTVTVTDSHGCTTTGVGTITEPEPWRPCISGPTQACQGSTKTYCICPDTQRPGSTYQWTVSGGTITDGCCGLCKTIIWDHCASGKVCVTETRADGCIMTTCIDVYLVPVPTPVITGPITIYPDSTSVYTTTYSPCYLYSWSVIGGNIVAGAGTNTITVLWGECGPCNPGQVKVCVTDQCNGLHEDFESGNFPPTGFTQIITSTSTNFNLPETWSQGDPSTPFIATHAGNGSAYLWWAYATPQDEWLIAHNVKVTGDLNFWSYVMPGTASNGDHYYVKVSTDQGATWTALMDFATMPAYPSVSGFNEWNEPYNINMTAYSGMMVDIAWQAVNPIGVWAVWGLDDITLGGNKIAVNPTGHASTNNYKGDAQLTKASGIYRQTTGTASGFTPSSNYQSPTACCGCATLDINILASPAPKIQGYVKYKNDGVTGGFPTALNGVTVTLWNASGNIVGTTVTGPNFNSMGEPGYYAFNSVPNANYHMTASFNGAFGGNNATDALIVQLNCIGSYPLHGLDSIVADVNGSMTTTALDALYIKLRTVGMITSYPAGDWKFTSPSFALTAPVTLDIQGLCVGDVNDSYIPTGLKSASFLAPVDGGIMTIPVNESFNYNITSNTISKLGAMTLFMNYDQNRFEIEKVITSLEGMKYVIDNGQISLAWSDTKSLSLKSDDPIISLQMKAKQAVTEPTQIFSINPGSEFADPNANRYDNFEVKLSKVMTTSGQNDFNIFNYPNPFQNTTDIVYTLPEQARVKLVLTNMFGQIIRTLVDAEQSAGTYNVNVNPLNDNLKTGVYLYRIEVSGATNSYNKTNKMLFTR